MKNASRLLAMLLAVAMFAAVAFTVSAFEDVKVSDDCYTAVNTLVSLDVIKGKTETTFAPEDAVTREQMAALMSRLYTTVATEGGDNYTPFTDLDDPYYNYVISWCYDAGVINGTTPSTFEPKANIMLQDAVTMACRLLGYEDLTYPLGYITKGRLIGLLDGLEGVAYDKELTRGETAILLYNALDADGAELIRENRVTWYYDKNGNGYPVADAYDRNFQIALDVYNFKTETYQIVGTESFNLAGFAKATEDSYHLVELDSKGQAVANNHFFMDFEDLMIAEDTNGDANIMAHLEILYKGDTLDAQDTVVLSSVIKSNLNATNEVSVYFKKDNTTGKMVAQDDKIAIDGKAYEADEYVFVMDANGVISDWDYTVDDEDTNEDESVNLATIAPVFYQEDQKDEGKYAQIVADLDNDGDVDAVLFFPMTLQEVTGLTSKGVYTLKDLNTNTTEKYDTQDEDCKLVIVAEDVAKNDYVLTYQVGPYTYIEEVLEPVITKVTKKSTTKYTLATGDVVTFAKANNPLVGNDLTGNTLALDGEEIALYIVNDKIVYTDSADAIGYTPYNYAFVVNKADEETSVDTEDGTIEIVYNLIAFINGKAVTIPTSEDYSTKGSYIKSMVTIIDIKDGKYILEPGIKVKDADYEELIDGNDSTITYNRYSKVYKINGKTVLLDANSEFYVQTNNAAQEYESIKRYTMTNTPTTALENQKLDAAIIRKNFDENDKVESYTLVVAYTTVDPDNTFASGTGYADHRIVLEKGLTLDDKGASYATYELLNPVTGAIESVVDDTVEVNDVSAIDIGAVVTIKSSGKVSVAANTTGVATGLHADMKMKQIARVLNDNLVTLYSGNAMGGEISQEIVLNGAKIVVLDYNEEEELEIEVTDDYSELAGKVIRAYTESGMNYKPYYFVVLPYEWVEGDFADLSAYEEDPAYNA